MSGDIEQWLKQLGLGEYRQAFTENRIDAYILPTLTNDDLKDIGVVAVGDRRKMLNAVAALSSGVEAPAGNIAADRHPPEKRNAAGSR
jgi:hypothetical protein